MKKDGWIGLGIAIVIPGIIGLGMAYMRSYINFVLFLFCSLVLIIFFLICIEFFSEPEKVRVVEMLREFIKPLIDDSDGAIRVIDESLHDERFLHPIKQSLKPKYGFAHRDILGKKHDIWIRGKVDEYNRLAKTIYETVPKFKQAIRESIKQQFPDDMDIINKKMRFFVDNVAYNSSSPVATEGEVSKFWNEHIGEFLEVRSKPVPQEHIREIRRCLEEAKEVAVKLKKRLEELKEKHLIKSGIPKGEITQEEKKKDSRGLI